MNLKYIHSCYLLLIVWYRTFLINTIIKYVLYLVFWLLGLIKRHMVLLSCFKYPDLNWHKPDASQYLTTSLSSWRFQITLEKLEARRKIKFLIAESNFAKLPNNINLIELISDTPETKINCGVRLLWAFQSRLLILCLDTYVQLFVKRLKSSAFYLLILEGRIDTAPDISVSLLHSAALDANLLRTSLDSNLFFVQARLFRNL